MRSREGRRVQNCCHVYTVKTFRVMHKIFSHKSIRKAFIHHYKDKSREKKFLGPAPVAIARLNQFNSCYRLMERYVEEWKPVTERAHAQVSKERTSMLALPIHHISNIILPP